MLPGLEELLLGVPKTQRHGWVVAPLPIQYEIRSDASFIRPTKSGLKGLAACYSNRTIARACGVSDTTVRKWLAVEKITRPEEFQTSTGEIPEPELISIRKRATRKQSRSAQRTTSRLTKERVSRVISMIGEEAGVIVRQGDKRTGRKRKFASAHVIRRGCVQRLINHCVSAETRKVVFRIRQTVSGVA